MIYIDTFSLPRARAGQARRASFTEVLALVLGLAIAPSPLQAASDTILTVTGDFDQDGTEDEARFSRDDLAKLGETSFTTSTIWTEGPQAFTGVWLSKLVESLKIEQGQLKVVALNDYSVEIPVSEIVEGGALLAYARNGKDMAVRDKGPLWIVYPYDSSDNFRNEVIYSRSIWQVARMVAVGE